MLKVNIIGAGPAGLYCAYRLKKALKECVQVNIYERSGPNETWGFGVVFSAQALEFLRDSDPTTHCLVDQCLQRWTDIYVDLNGERVVLDGVGFAAMSRLELLQILQQQLQSLGIEPNYHTTIETIENMSGADLVVIADGANSVMREGYKEHFGVTVKEHSNYFIWYGTAVEFPCLTQTFRAAKNGFYNAHHYRYDRNKSTFIVETDSQTWHQTNFANMDDEAARRYLEEIFATELAGQPLISNSSRWRKFPRMQIDRWWWENCVLLGDALHTAHFSIGSGTRLALEDAIQLAGSVVEFPGNIERALIHFQEQRQPAVEKLVSASYRSMDWYTDFASHMQMPAMEFAYSYFQRTGQMDDATLSRIAPLFMQSYKKIRSN